MDSTTTKPKKQPARRSLASRYAKWLANYIDPHDWAYDHIGKGGTRSILRMQSERLERYYRKECYPQRIGPKLIAAHLRQSPRLHYTSYRKSGFALLRIDVDAHDGQDDALEAAEHIRQTYFPAAYLEATTRGCAIYLVVRVGRVPRNRFNEVICHLADALAAILDEHNFASTVEVQGGFTIVEGGIIVHRAKAGALPALPNGESDLAWLIGMPAYLLKAIKRVTYDAHALADKANQTDTREPTHHKLQVIYTVPAVVSCGGDAFARMNVACFDFTCQYRRMPGLDELLGFYEKRYDRGAAHEQRIQRAIAVIKLREKTFDISRATDGGYSVYKDQLMAAVKTHAINRESKYLFEITDEDLAIALFTVQVASFGIADNPKRQWTVPSNRFAGMFEALKREGLTTRCASDRSKVRALKQILVRARLIECIDAKWVHSGKDTGIGQKFHIGPNHTRYAEFCRFAEGVEVQYIKTADEASTMQVAN